MDVNKIVERYNKLKSVRDGYWMQLWKSVRRYVYPTEQVEKTEGGERGNDIFDDTAIDCRQRLAAGMYSWMLDPTKRLIELSAADPELAEDAEIKEFFAKATKVIIDMMANSNWPTAVIQMLNNLAAGMDGIIYAEEDDALGVNLRSFPVETVCYSENSKGHADTMFRELSMTARQIVQEFGDSGKLPDYIISDAASIDRMDKAYKLLHCVFPRQQRDHELADNVNFPFVDLYIELEKKTLIYESGFMEFPFAVCHFDKSDGETFGRGPGLNKLSSIRMLNRMRQAYIVSYEMTADPPWLIPNGSLVDRNFDKRAGAINIYKADVSGLKPEQIIPKGNIVQLSADIMEERSNIKTGFFLDIFDPLGELKNITATEAEIRNEAKIVPFAPIVGNVYSGFLNPMVQRFWGIAERSGKLPPIPPRLLENPHYKIGYVSKIALAIKRIEASAWISTEASLANVMQINPAIIDNFDLDRVARDIAGAAGVNPYWITPERKRDKIRADREQQQQAMQAAQTMIEGAKAVPAISQRPENGSILQSIMDNAQ